MNLLAVLESSLRALVISTGLYLTLLTLLAIPFFQNHIIYLHQVTLTWFQDVNFPERWGFLHNQVTPFFLRTSDNKFIHAWHVLPLEVYRRNEAALLEEPSGLASDITSSLSFKLLRDDPGALLVLYFHGAAGTLGSGWRPPSYRAIYAGATDKIHVLAIDYRGFGRSTGSPSEDGLLIDALTLADWAMNVAGIPPSRIVLFGQSLGTAVSISLAHYMAVSRPAPTLFAGMVLVAPLVDVKTLTATYRLAGTIPILSPVAFFPRLLDFLNGFILSKWSTKDKITQFVRFCETKEIDTQKDDDILLYHIDIVHGKDDYDIPWSHSEQVFWHAVNGSLPLGISFQDLEKEKQQTRIPLGAGGWAVEKRSEHGTIRENVLENGLHDVIMSYPVVSLAIVRAFQYPR